VLGVDGVGEAGAGDVRGRGGGAGVGFYVFKYCSSGKRGAHMQDSR